MISLCCLQPYPVEGRHTKKQNKKHNFKVAQETSLRINQTKSLRCIYLSSWQICWLVMVSRPGRSAMFQWLDGTPDSINAFSRSLKQIHIILGFLRKAAKIFCVCSVHLLKLLGHRELIFFFRKPGEFYRIQMYNMNTKTNHNFMFKIQVVWLVV